MMPDVDPHDPRCPDCTHVASAHDDEYQCQNAATSGVGERGGWRCHCGTSELAIYRYWLTLVLATKVV